MSNPRNHHYVSRCHQKEFFNDLTGKIYLYDKEKKNYYYKKSTKNLFSYNDLNTKITNEQIDYISIEKEFKILFEDRFKSNLNIVESCVVDKQASAQLYSALGALTLIGFLGEARHPYYKKEIDQAVDSILNRIYPNISKDNTLPFDNDISPISVGLKILASFEPIDFQIVFIESSDHFLLPDTSCSQQRGQLSKGLSYHLQEIIEVSIPLSDKLFIRVTPQFLHRQKTGILSISKDESSTIDQINTELFHFYKKAVACKDESYIKYIVEKI